MNQVQRRLIRVQYMKKATICLGRQPDSDVWVLNDRVHLDSSGNRISTNVSEYIWLGSMIGNRRNLSNIAPPSDAAVITLIL